jgi:hypothetical protein
MHKAKGVFLLFHVHTGHRVDAMAVGVGGSLGCDAVRVTWLVDRERLVCAYSRAIYLLRFVKQGA